MKQKAMKKNERKKFFAREGYLVGTVEGNGLVELSLFFLPNFFRDLE